MPHFQFFDFRDDSQQRWDDILANQKDAAQSLAQELVDSAAQDENGCLVTDTTAISKVRFAGSQFAAYRFIYCALSGSTRLNCRWAKAAAYRVRSTSRSALARSANSTWPWALRARDRASNSAGASAVRKASATAASTRAARMCWQVGKPECERKWLQTYSPPPL